MLCSAQCSQLSTILFSIVTPNSDSIILLTIMNNVRSTTLFNLVKQQIQNFWLCKTFCTLPYNGNFPGKTRKFSRKNVEIFQKKTWKSFSKKRENLPLEKMWKFFSKKCENFPPEKTWKFSRKRAEIFRKNMKMVQMVQWVTHGQFKLICMDYT